MVIYPLRSSNISDMRAYNLTDELFSIEKTDPFVSEFELVDKFMNVTNLNDTINGYTSEFDAGNGVADIVLYKLRSDWNRYANITKIKPQWANALIVLPYRKLFDLNYFSNLTCVTRATALRILNDYIEAGYCQKRKSGWIKIKQPRPPIPKMYAIEAKLRDWKKALHQATRYLDFAHQSWVLLDNYYCLPAIENKMEFEKRKIGLMTIRPSGALTILIDAVATAPRSPIRYWNANVTILNKLVS